MSVRRAAEDDLPALYELRREFEAEIPEWSHRDVDPEKEDAEVREYVGRHLALVAEADGVPVGFALAKLETPRICHLSDIYLRPDWRSKGLGRDLMAAAVHWGEARGAEVMTLEVLASNAPARAFYAQLGFAEESVSLVTPLGALTDRLAAPERGVSFGSIHVQTDDLQAVVRAVRQYVPRLPGGSEGSAVHSPTNGWTAVYDELCDREPSMLHRLALELSDRMGAVVLALGVEHGDVVHYILFERGSIVDEYLSVPELHGPLPPGDVIGLGANPTVVARLTGADAARVREIARTAKSPGELPPAPELLATLADAMGIEGAGLDYARARELPDVVPLSR
jgi:ribosomal protein S18 acetylase RimI-like enzyme